MMKGSGFDRIARAYRWLEYLCLGRSLERCRALQLARFEGARRVLVLGDGDGRFTANLLARYGEVQVVAVDSSAVMLALLSARVRAIGASPRLSVVHSEAVSLFENRFPHDGALDGVGQARADREAAHNGLFPLEGGFDHVCSHFFLDCLATPEVHRLVAGVSPRLAPGAYWIVSEFAAPSWWAHAVVALLYRAFGVLAGLRTQQLPQWREALAAHQFARIDEQHRLGGLLTSSVWIWQGCASDQETPS